MWFRFLLFLSSLQLWSCQENYYAATYFKANWFNAEQACLRSDMNLASVTSLQQHLQLIRSITLNGHLLGSEKFWLGGNNLGDLSSWHWLSTGTLFGYKKWAKDEPQSELTGREGCLVLGLDEEWHSEDCGEEYYFICERSCNANAIVQPIYI